MSEETELAEDAATETMDAETAARVSAENMRLLENHRRGADGRGKGRNQDP